MQSGYLRKFCCVRKGGAQGHRLEMKMKQRVVCCFVFLFKYIEKLWVSSVSVMEKKRDKARDIY